MGRRSQLTQRHEVKILIAVVTCHKFRSRADAQRNMLVKDMHCWKKGMKVAYCVGVNVDTMPPFPGVVARTIMDHMQKRKERARIINERVRSSLLEKRKRN